MFRKSSPISFFFVSFPVFLYYFLGEGSNIDGRQGQRTVDVGVGWPATAGLGRAIRPGGRPSGAPVTATAACGRPGLPPERGPAFVVRGPATAGPPWGKRRRPVVPSGPAAARRRGLGHSVAWRLGPATVPTTTTTTTTTTTVPTTRRWRWQLGPARRPR